jgi:phasin family protein
MPTQNRKTNGNNFANGWDANGSFEKLADAGRENMEALVASTSIAAHGLGAVNQAWFDFAKATLERNGAAAEAIFSARNAADAAELQTDWARNAFDNYVSESSKITEMAVKTANEAVAPIRARVDGAVEKFAENNG